MIRSQERLRLCGALLICNLVFIWGNSLMTAEISSAISDLARQTVNLVLGIFPSANEESLKGDGVLRKIAHFTEFASLGLLLGWLFGMLQKRKIYPFLCGTAAACIDETIQIFVPGRGPGIKDVCIDAGGVVTGMILLYLGYTCFKKKQSLEDN